MLDLTIGFIVFIVLLSIISFIVTEKWHDFDEFCEWVEKEKEIRWYWKHWNDNLPKRDHMKYYNPWYSSDKQMKRYYKELKKAQRAGTR